jgi:hypothetical protein
MSQTSPETASVDECLSLAEAFEDAAAIETIGRAGRRLPIGSAKLVAAALRKHAATLYAALAKPGLAQTPDLEAAVSNIMCIRNGMTLDSDAEALIRKEIGALMGSHAQNSKQWQPIKTAPKGVRLLLFSPGHKISDDPDERAVIITSTTRDWNWATHWMPLPAPPALSDTSTDGNNT